MTIHDEALAARVINALMMDKRISGLPISARVCSGEVFLKGKVDTLDQVDVIQFVVSGIAGVRHVDVREIEVKEPGR